MSRSDEHSGRTGSGVSGVGGAAAESALYALPVVFAGALLVLFAGLDLVAAIVSGLAIISLQFLLLLRRRRRLGNIEVELVSIADGGLVNRTSFASWPEPDPENGLAVALDRTVDRLLRDYQSLDTHAKRAENVIETLPSPLILINGRQQIVRANREAEKIFDRSLDGVELSSVVRRPETISAIRDMLHTGMGSSVEFSMTTPHERVFSLIMEPLKPAPDSSYEAMLLFSEITGIVKADQMRADFVANVSHELKTPLASLTGFIETLQGPARDDADARDQFLGVMADQASRMGRLVTDLLALSRIEANEHSTPTDSVDLVACVKTVCAGLQPEADAKNMNIEIVENGAVPNVVGSAEELTQVIENLVENALRYGREETPVQVTMEWQPPNGSGIASSKGRVVMTVIDRGEGIDTAHIPRLTERFYRAGPARSRALGGTGLGLAIVKHIVNRHRGRLSIESVLDEGSRFAVALPAAEGVDTVVSIRTGSEVR